MMRRLSQGHMALLLRCSQEGSVRVTTDHLPAQQLAAEGLVKREGVKGGYLCQLTKEGVLAASQAQQRANFRAGQQVWLMDLRTGQGGYHTITKVRRVSMAVDGASFGFDGLPVNGSEDRLMFMNELEAASYWKYSRGAR